MIKLYTWEFSLLIILEVFFFFLVMILRKQMDDFFGFKINLFVALPSTIASSLIFGIFFGLKISFYAGVLGLIAGMILSYFWEGGESGTEIIGGDYGSY
jgi:hypothetical protein